MASLLLRVERGVLDRIRARADGEQAELLPGELPQPELSHLDPNGVAFVVWLDGGALRCGMTVHEPVLDRGRLVGGDVLLHDHELTHLLPRLGCPQPGEVAAWSAVPRLLPPNDVDLLRYELGLPMDARRNLVMPPVTVAPEDELDRAMLLEIWGHPDADELRMIYADRLQQRSDARGELIALQLARGSGRISDRERALVAKWGEACTRPLAQFLEAYELRRGFLSRATVDERQPFPQSLLEHPMWALVEELQTSHQALLRLAPLTSLRRLRTTGSTLLFLSSYSKTFSRVDSLLGFQTPPARKYRGIQLTGLAPWQLVGASTVWPALRTLSVEPSRGVALMVVPSILGSALGRQLVHLDVTTDAMGDELEPDVLFAALARSDTIQRVSVQLDFDHRIVEPLVIIYDRMANGSFELRLQVPPLSGRTLHGALPQIVSFGSGIDRVTVTFVPVAKRRELEPQLIAALRRHFPRVEVAEESTRPLCPWAYHSAAVPSVPMP